MTLTVTGCHGSMLLTLLWDLPFANVSFLWGAVLGTQEVLTLFPGLFTALFTCQTNSQKDPCPGHTAGSQNSRTEPSPPGLSYGKVRGGG